MFKLVPLATTKIDWDSYLRLATEAIGRSPTSKLDETWHVVTRSIADYMATLKEIEMKDSDPHTGAGVLLEHVHHSFMMIASRLATFSIIMKTRVAATTIPTTHDDFNFTILSGNLSQWRSAILNCCVPDVSFDVRSFGTALIEHFDSVGLKRYILDAIQVQLGDGTVRLLERK